MKHVLKILCIVLAVLLFGGCMQQTTPLPQEPTTTAGEATTTKIDTTTTTINETTTIVTKEVTTTAATTKKSQTAKPTTKAPTTAKPTTQKTTAWVTSTTAQLPLIPDNAEAVRQEVVRLVNEERAKEGLAALTYYPEAQAAVDLRAEETTTAFSHTRPNGSLCFTVITEFNLECMGAGENIAYGYETAASVMNGWMNSQGHRDNIMNGTYTAIAVGYIVKDDICYWVQMFFRR